MADRQAAADRAATLVFTGRFNLDAFTAFAEHRAQRLDVVAGLIEATPNRVSFAVAGSPELIVAFEMACSLGPESCLVLDVARQDHP